MHATLIDYLDEGGAKAVVYDVLFAEADRSRIIISEATRSRLKGLAMYEVRPVTAIATVPAGSAGLTGGTA